MKAWLLKLTGLVLALVLLAGCAPAQTEEEIAPEPTETVTEEPVDQEEPEKLEPFGLAYEPDAGLNPYSCMALSNRTVLSLLYEPLFAVNASFEAVPYLCESYAVSGDGRTHTLTLRQGITFSDGTALTAADAAASILAAKNSAYYGSRLRHVTGATATSDLVVTVTTDVACGTLEKLLNIYVVKSGTAGDAIPVGSGPYRADGAQLVQTAWWRDEAPAVNETAINLVTVNTAAEIRDQFEYGQITLACADPNGGSRITYHSDFELWNNNTTVMQYIGFNLNSPVFVYSSLRAAITYAIDRDSLASATAGGFAAAAVLPASPYASSYDQKLADSYAYNPEAFQSALAASEIADHTGNDGILEVFTEDGAQPLSGKMIVCNTSEQRVAAAQTVVDTLNGYGFQLTLESLEYNEYVSALNNGNFDLYYGEARLSPDFDLSPFFAEGGSLSYGGIADSAVELLCAQAVENEGNAYNLHQKVMERGLICPVLFKTYAVYSARGRVPNLNPCLDGVFLTPPES